MAMSMFPQNRKVASPVHEIPGEEKLSPAECRVVALVADGLTDREIADILIVSPHTVRAHVEHARYKLRAKCKAELVAKALRRGYIE